MRIIGISGLAGSGKDTAAKFLVERHGYVVVALADELKRIAQRLYDFTDEQLWGPSEKRNEPDRTRWRPCFPCCQRGRVKVPVGEGKYDQDGAWTGEQEERTCKFCEGAGKIFLSPRLALQILGTEVGRNIYPNTWVDIVFRNGRKLHNGREQPGAKADPLVFGTGYAAPLGVLESWDQGAVPLPYRWIRRVGITGGITIPDVRFKNEIDAIRGEGGYLVRVKRPKAGLDGAAGQHVSETEQQEIPDSEFDAVLDNSSTIEALGRQVDQVVEAYRDRIRRELYNQRVPVLRAQGQNQPGQRGGIRPYAPGQDDVPPFKRKV